MFKKLPPTTLQETFITRSIIAICAFLWVVQIVDPPFTGEYALDASKITSEPYRLFTSMWLHSTFPLHIMVNMFSLWVLGSQMETLIKGKRFAIVYLVSGLASGGAIWLSHPSLPAVGASGAIFGILGFVVVWSRFAWNAVFVAIINIMLGFFIPNIAWQGHLGGFFAGAVLAFWWHTLPDLRKQKTS